ncbi:hypothetical protein UY3_02324 [Chelonia mydas]|uniref:Uncharacterized protein n=1 Tax=Chelonia mydas TaxID=8469 RepID=M7BT95_CHEMY|nr:hypothetical protein UY3_02324 [Chelonia mydas]
MAWPSGPGTIDSGPDRRSFKSAVNTSTDPDIGSSSGTISGTDDGTVCSIYGGAACGTVSGTFCGTAPCSPGQAHSVTVTFPIAPPVQLTVPAPVPAAPSCGLIGTDGILATPVAGLRTMSLLDSLGLSGSGTGLQGRLGGIRSPCSHLSDVGVMPHPQGSGGSSMGQGSWAFTPRHSI